MNEMLQISVKMQLSGSLSPVLLMYGKKGVRCPLYIAKIYLKERGNES